MTQRFTSIICPTDFSELSDQALTYGLELAEEYGATLSAVHVIDLSTASMYGEFLLDPQDIQAQIENYAVEHIGELVGNRNVKWEVLIAMGNPAEETARLALKKRADLAVTATHGRSGLQRLLLGSVTERLMRPLPCPLLVVPGEAMQTKPKAGYRRIMVGCDFSPDADLAVSYAFDLATEFDSDIHLVHVIEPERFKDMLRKEGEPTTESRQMLRDRLTGKLAELIPQGAYKKCEPKVTLLAGQPHEELTKFAVINDVDLIVLGVHGRGFVESLLVGSTTDRVVRTASCAVLSVRPPTYAKSL